MYTQASENEKRIVQEEFEKYNFHNYAIVDKLRDITREQESDTSWIDFCGHSFAVPEGESESVKISFHVYMDERLNVMEVYAYECDGGQEIGCRNNDNQQAPSA